MAKKGTMIAGAGCAILALGGLCAIGAGAGGWIYMTRSASDALDETFMAVAAEVEAVEAAEADLAGDAADEGSADEELAGDAEEAALEGDEAEEG